ncbi:hypothetical protein [Aeromicrobium sp. CnD17-E]|uniref:hypothetical protein n=1 Tax=Aeromicrobium sp. CnD17-E TaxID=2954487 RepID=UPI002096AAAD|nr:hypothetical protein [Aeromicrobium sp. CnD17-E]MCO7240396.1 hypothetical protein [Aeromicrobium sp. CnD17-E]
MPLHTYVAGSPASLIALAASLEQGFSDACENLGTSLLRHRRQVRDHWHGGAGRAAAEGVQDLARSADGLRTAGRRIAAGVETFAGVLRGVQNRIEDARDVARSAGLVVTERLVEEPPEPADPRWKLSTTISVDADEQGAFLAWKAKVSAWNHVVGAVEAAFGDLAAGCRELNEALGDQASELAEIGEKLSDAAPGALDAVGEKVLPKVEARMGRAAVHAGFLASLSPEQSKLLYANLFTQMEHLDDASAVRHLAEVSKYGGKTVDGFMIGFKAIERDQMGQGMRQIVLAEGGGWAAGALATGLTWAGGGAVFGAPATPVGSAVLGGVALVAGVVVGALTSDAVDDWYEDEAFEDLIRKASKDDARPGPGPLSGTGDPRGRGMPTR